jgi:hypothetical protein
MADVAQDDGAHPEQLAIEARAVGRAEIAQR